MRGVNTNSLNIPLIGLPPWTHSFQPWVQSWHNTFPPTCMTLGSFTAKAKLVQLTRSDAVIIAKTTPPISLYLSLCPKSVWDESTSSKEANISSRGALTRSGRALLATCNPLEHIYCKLLVPILNIFRSFNRTYHIPLLRDKLNISICGSYESLEGDEGIGEMKEEKRRENNSFFCLNVIINN